MTSLTLLVTKKKGIQLTRTRILVCLHGWRPSSLHHSYPINLGLYFASNLIEESTESKFTAGAKLKIDKTKHSPRATGSPILVPSCLLG